MVSASAPIYPHTLIRPPDDFDPTRHRKWLQLQPHKPNSLSVCSYNLLSQHYVWEKVFGYLDPNYLDWNYRFPLIQKTVQQLQCDILCFQELEYLVYRDWRIPGYTLHYVRKPPPLYWGTKLEDNMDGVGIYVKSNRFTVLHSQEINFGKYLLLLQTKFDLTSDLMNRLVPRNTVALLLKLYDKHCDRNIYIANTHLYWSPKYNDVKVLQTKILLELLKDFVDEEDPTLVLCGDFNSTPDLLVFRLLRDREIDIKHSGEFRHFDYGSRLQNEALVDGKVKSPFLLAPAYGPLLEENLHFTSFTRSLTAVLDHIWLLPNKLAVCKVLGEVSTSYLDGEHVEGFPNNEFPSDHIPLVSELAYIDPV